MRAEPFLCVKHPRRVPRRRLEKSENKICRGHKIQREHIELDQDPEHQRHAEQAAKKYARTFFRKQQSRRGQVGYAVDDEQCDPRKQEVGKQNVRERQLLKTGQHGVHPHGFSRWIGQHSDRPRDRAKARIQCPKQQQVSCNAKL